LSLRGDEVRQRGRADLSPDLAGPVRKRLANLASPAVVRTDFQFRWRGRHDQRDLAVKHHCELSSSQHLTQNVAGAPEIFPSQSHFSDPAALLSPMVLLGANASSSPVLAAMNLVQQRR